jgi:flagellar hook-associated protein 1 FlgK
MSILSTGTSALLAFQRALSTVGHNVANAQTPGFSRQRVELANNPGQLTGAGFIGTGVQTTSITRQADSFIFGRSLDSTAELGRLTELSGLASRLDRGFTDPGSSLNGPVSEFLDAAQSVASQPASTAARQEFLSAAESLSTRLRSLDGQLRAFDGEINGKLVAGANEANQLSAEIARLNLEIVRQTGASGGQQPNDLLDQREQRVAELSALIGVTATVQDDNSLNIFTLGGQALVVGSTTQQLTTVADPFQPERRELALVTSGGNVRLGANSVGGELGGLLEFRHAILDPTAEQLGRLAIGITEGFNALHAQGVDVFGDLGGNLFVPVSPRVSPNAGNTGAGSLSATVTDPATLPSGDLVLGFDGSVWTATQRGSSAPLALTGSGTAGDPLRVGGLALVVGGTPAAGDRFLVRPTAGAASTVRVAISDPARIAAASPLAASASLANTSDARPQIEITDTSATGFLADRQIVFLDATSYELDGVGPFAYDPAAGIAGPGFVLRLDGTPQAGDRFDVAPRGPGSSDNGNMRLIGAFGNRGLFDGGTVSINAALGQMTVSIGAGARQAELSREAQSQLATRLSAERESVSGVNLDEEAANLLRFQQAYQAAAQIISTADSLFQTLLSAVRR